LKNKNHLFKLQRGDINIAWGSAPGNPSYDHVEYNLGSGIFLGTKAQIVTVNNINYTLHGYKLDCNLLKTSENFVASNNFNDLHKIGSRKINTLHSIFSFLMKTGVIKLRCVGSYQTN
jgi:hypothetical protein